MNIFGDFLYAFITSFYPKITLPTRFSNYNATLIDIVVCELSKPTINITSGVLVCQSLNDLKNSNMLQNMNIISNS